MSAITTIERTGSGPKFSHSEAAKSLTVLFEIRGRVVEDFVLLSKGVDLPSICVSKTSAAEAVQR